jgi:2-polyprenyl-6-hydroxyphenyl methylase/3-demethylubiquinone-9 3-methyltransferase
MSSDRLRYNTDHWIRSDDPGQALEAYLEQQSKAYSRVKNAFVAELLGDLNGKRFLDYGCGAGMFAVHAAMGGAALVVGMDAEDTALDAARLFARREGVERQCAFVRMERLPRFPPKTRFDAILLKDVIEHVEDDETLLGLAAQALSPGGIIVLSTQNALSLNYLIEGGYHRLVKGDSDWPGWDATHLRFYTPAGLTAMLKRAGLKAAAWRSAYIIPYKLPPLPGSRKQFFRIDPLSWVDRTLGRFFPFHFFGWNIIVKAEACPLVRAAFPLRSMRSAKGIPTLAALSPPAVTRSTTESL